MNRAPFLQLLRNLPARITTARLIGRRDNVRSLPIILTVPLPIHGAESIFYPPRRGMLHGITGRPCRVRAFFGIVPARKLPVPFRAEALLEVGTLARGLARALDVVVAVAAPGRGMGHKAPGGIGPW